MGQDLDQVCLHSVADGYLSKAVEGVCVAQEGAEILGREEQEWEHEIEAKELSIVTV